MKTVSAICVYHGTTIYNLTVNYKGDITTLKRYDISDNNVVEYNNFKEMYKAILKILKAKNFKVTYTEDFMSRWYNIQFIDALNPTRIETFSFKK